MYQWYLLARRASIALHCTVDGDVEVADAVCLHISEDPLQMRLGCGYVEKQKLRAVRATDDTEVRIYACEDMQMDLRP